MSATPEVISGDGFTAEVIRTNRKKTIAIKIADGRVVLRVPKKTRRNDLKTLIDGKSRWIQEKLLYQQTNPRPAPKSFVTGELFGYQGISYPLKVETGRARRVKLDGDCIGVRVPTSVRKQSQYVATALTDWYRKEALIRLEQRVAYFSSILEVEPLSIGVRTYKARWGSCSIEGRLMFNWKIILAPEKILDYLVVHELCHLIEHNHSRAFWNHVEAVLPDYRESKKWLRDNGNQLTL